MSNYEIVKPGSNVYCDICSTLTPATRIIRITFDRDFPEKNTGIAVCEAHYKPGYTPAGTI